jgi:hypothetical protein
LYPPQKAIIRAITEFTTDEKELTAQAQGMSFSSLKPKSLIPVGKGKPIRKPSGKINKNARRTFIPKPKPINPRQKAGRTRMSRVIRQADKKRLVLSLVLRLERRILLEQRLPTPEEKRSEKRMVEME